MTSITLLPHAEKLAPDGAVPEYRHTVPLLYHQVRTYAALEESPLVMNTYPTGTGKTVAALLRLLHPAQRGHSTLLIAPTNALIAQHAAEAREFIARHGLRMRVFEADAAALGALDDQLRPGERLQRFLENPLTFASQLGLPDDAEKQPCVVVTNPDIFYYGLYFQYRRNDQRNVFSKFIECFRYLIVDEFHYYDNKQFANFLLFFALWKQWGYFAHGRSICLLSATPRQNVYTYLNRLFGIGAWQIVGPENEPPESLAYPTTPTLTALQLTLAANSIESWAVAHQAEIERWQALGLDGAIISSSLARINEIYQTLRHLDPVRITGPEPHAARQRLRPLILATPTVDIGYNFGRPGKARQSIDRLVCDARFGDELTQRIGRVGRVLGRHTTDEPSEAIVVLSEDAADELRAYDGQTFTRHEWAAVVTGLQQLPAKHQLDGYIRSQAIVEAFYPIYQIGSLMQDEDAAIEELYQTIREIFAPNSPPRHKMLKVFFHKYEQRRRWLAESPESKRWALDERNIKVLAQLFADYVSWMQSRRGMEVRERGEKYRAVLPALLTSQPQQKRALTAFAESQVALTKALFNFREAWQGPATAIADPQHLLSSESVSQYDLLHLVANYQLRLFPNQEAFSQATRSDAEAALYVELQRIRDPKLTLGFDYQSQWPRQEFEERHCRSVVALRGLHLNAKERRPETQPVMLDERIRVAVANNWIPCLIVAEASEYVLLSVLRGSPFYARELLVDFSDGTLGRYRIVTGTAAFHILPELRRHYAALDRALSDEAIIA